MDYPHMIHAEMNAIIHAGASLKDCTLYCTLSPCQECAKLITATGTRRVVYANLYENAPKSIVDRLKNCGVEAEEFWGPKSIKTEVGHDKR